MSDKKEAGRLILKDLAMFNEAVVLFENEIYPPIYDTLIEAVENWANQHDFLCDDETNNVFDIRFAPNKWLVDDITNSWFQLGYLDDGEGLSYLLADLCGVGTEQIGFRFLIDKAEFDGKKDWKRLFNSLKPEYVERLGAFGFRYENSVFKLPVKLDLEQLVVAWENDDYEEAFKPLTDALDTLEKSWQIFDELIEKVKAGL